MVHVRCRNRVYPFSIVSRLFVSDNQVPWSVPWKNYNPPEYNSEVLKGKPWADKDISANFSPQFNSRDGKINRTSYMGKYEVIEGYPLNPEGRTGLKGRGAMGRWGPNHAADPIVTRWKRINGVIQQDTKSKLPILECCVILRRDNNTWSLPGGMVDPGENIYSTLKREFMEEALNSLERNPQQTLDAHGIMLFASGKHVYSGYVDDPRNTDNAWVETFAVNYHDETGVAVDKFQLEAGDDAKDVKWLSVCEDMEMELNRTHSRLVQKVVELKKAHW